MAAMIEPYSEQAWSAAQWQELRSNTRSPGDGLDGGFGSPNELERLASRLERAKRVLQCRDLTQGMLSNLVNVAPGRVFVAYGVWVKDVNVDFLVFTWKGAFLVWSIDYRWTYRQAALMMGARTQIQEELEGWPGQVEAIFHSPREGTGASRHVGLDEKTGDPLDIVIAGGRLDEVLMDWQPAGGVGLDPEWLSWLAAASQPRWWRSAEGQRELPEPPAHDRL